MVPGRLCCRRHGGGQTRLWPSPGNLTCHPPLPARLIARLAELKRQLAEAGYEEMGTGWGAAGMACPARRCRRGEQGAPSGGACHP